MALISAAIAILLGSGHGNLQSAAMRQTCELYHSILDARILDFGLEEIWRKTHTQYNQSSSPQVLKSSIPNLKLSDFGLGIREEAGYKREYWSVLFSIQNLKSKIGLSLDNR